MAWVFKDFLMVLYIMGITGITNLMVGESLQITKDKFMKENGKMEQNKEMDSGKV